MEGPVVFMGWLLVVKDIDLLKSVLGDKAGSIKAATWQSLIITLNVHFGRDVPCRAVP